MSAGEPAGVSRLDEDRARLLSVRAVLFDLDGTLIDTVALILTSMRHAVDEVLGLRLPDDELMRNVGIPLAVQMRSFSEDKADELVAAYRQHNAVVHDDLIADYPGTGSVLRTLKDRGLPLGIVTSKSRHVAMRGLDRFDLAGSFDVVICADDVAVHKPDPYPLVVAAQGLGVPLERCIYLGDSPHDMRAAVDGGAVAVAALWGAFAPAEVLAPGPAFALRSVTELPDLLDGADVERFLAAGIETDAT